MNYLVSSSPRRKKLLREAGIRFKTLKPDYKERDVRGRSVSATVRAHAMGKGLSVKGIRQGTILSADTVVYFERKIIGKPKNLSDAYHILRALQGQWHTVYTGVFILKLKGGREVSRKYLCEKTRVRIRCMDERGIKKYFRRINPLDKAGAYALQSRYSIVEEMRGLRSNAVGLPLEKIIHWIKA